MKYDINILKGIHPGIIIERDLRRLNLSQKDLARKIGEYPSRITEIIKGRRKLNVPLSLKLEQELGYETGFLMTLQLFYEIRLIENSRQPTPDITKLSPSLFWDTKIEKIDWLRHKRAVIERVMTYGNAEEKAEIRRFYGERQVEKYTRPANSYRIAYLAKPKST